MAQHGVAGLLFIVQSTIIIITAQNTRNAQPTFVRAFAPGLTQKLTPARASRARGPQNRLHRVLSRAAGRVRRRRARGGVLLSSPLHHLLRKGLHRLIIASAGSASCAKHERVGWRDAADHEGRELRDATADLDAACGACEAHVGKGVELELDLDDRRRAVEAELHVLRIFGQCPELLGRHATMAEEKRVRRFVFSRPTRSSTDVCRTHSMIRINPLLRCRGFCCGLVVSRCCGVTVVLRLTSSPTKKPTWPSYSQWHSSKTWRSRQGDRS